MISRLALAAALGVGAVLFGAPAAAAPWVSGPPGASRVVRLAPQAEVPGPQVHLGQVAEIECPPGDTACARLDELVVGDAALPGQSRRLEVGRVLIRLRQAGYDTDALRVSAPDIALTVTTEAQRLDADRVGAGVKKALLDALPATLREGAQVDLDAVPLVWLPLGDVRIDVGPVAPVAGRFVLRVRVQVGDWSRTIQVRGALSVTAKLPVTTRSLGRHDHVDPADVTWREQALRGPLKYAALSLDHVRTTHYVPAGATLGAGDVEPIPAALAGAPVRVVAQVGAVSVSQAGTLLADSSLGERVRVRTEAGSVVYGRLIDPRTVAVRV